MLSLERVLAETGEKEAKSVKKICLSNKGISIIDNLRTCLWVERIDLSKNDIEDAGGLGECTGTKWLNLSQNRLISVEFMSSMLHMTVLNLGHNALKDISAIGRLINLKALILNDNKIKNAAGLEKLRNLNTLVLSHNGLTEFDLSGSLGGLVKLQLAHNKLSSFPNVKYNLELKNLLLNDNTISKVTADCVGSNNKLELVDLGRNKIDTLERISALSCITSIINLNLVGNPLSREANYVSEVMSLFRRLKTLDAMPVYKKVDELRKENDQKLNAKDQSSQIKKREQESLSSADEQEIEVEDNLPRSRKAKSITKKKCSSSENNLHEHNDSHQSKETRSVPDRSGKKNKKHKRTGECGNIVPLEKTSEEVNREDESSDKKKKSSGDVTTVVNKPLEVDTDNSKQDNGTKKKKIKISSDNVEDWFIDRLGDKPSSSEVQTKNTKVEKVHKKIKTCAAKSTDDLDDTETVVTEHGHTKSSTSVDDSVNGIHEKRPKGILPIKKNRQKTGVHKIVNVKSSIDLSAQSVDFDVLFKEDVCTGWT